MAPRKDYEDKATVPIQPIPGKRGYEFGGPYVVYCIRMLETRN